MNVRQLRKALEGLPDKMRVEVGYEGTTSDFGVYAGVWSVDGTTPDGRVWAPREQFGDKPVFVVGVP